MRALTLSLCLALACSGGDTTDSGTNEDGGESGGDEGGESGGESGGEGEEAPPPRPGI